MFQNLSLTIFLIISPFAVPSAVADDLEQLPSGTYQIDIAFDQSTIQSKTVTNPVIRRFNGKDFFYGKVATGYANARTNADFSGLPVLIRFDHVIQIQMVR